MVAQQQPPAGFGPDQNPLLYETERRNEALVRGFCVAWSAMDPDAIVSHLDEECIHERRKIYTGREGQLDWEFNVTGTLWIPQGRIRHRRDDSLPGARQIFSR